MGNKISVLILLIVLISVLLRLYGLNWDQDYHFHPDERMITMVAERIHLPLTQEEKEALFTPQSPLNPQFFAYGSFPIYLLKLVGWIVSLLLGVEYAFYSKINLVGRALSALFDIGTLLCLYFLGKKLINQYLGLIAAFLYSLAVLPIQLSHFYAVDTILTFFITLALYLSLKFQEKASPKIGLLLGIVSGLALATKISAVLIAIPIGISIISAFIYPLVKKRPLRHNIKILLPFLVNTLFLILITFITFLFAEPFALIDYPTFLKQNLEQQAMTKDAYTFPYTLQFVGKVPYLFELKNIFFFGLGPILASLAFAGSLFTLYRSFRPTFNTKYFILNTYFWLYFTVVGSFAIGFMRYLLPIYPLLCLFAAIFLFSVYQYLKSAISPLILHGIYLLLVVLLLIWPFAFINIYSQPNTRIQATNWIYQNIPPHSKIGREHWDDGLPLGGDIPYQINDLQIYDFNNPLIAQQIYQIVSSLDYIIIASNRLYVPLQRIADNCIKWNVPYPRCPNNADQYYRSLFDESLEFTKLAEFSVFPQLSFFNRQFVIDDSSADENFTVFDHPKVMIFRRR